MTLSSLVVSRDWAEVSVLQCILGSLHIGVDVETEPQRALDILAKSKIDALIVDSDLSGTPGLLRGLEDSFFQNTVPLVILSGPSGQRDFDSKDATFVFQKPISVEQAVRTFAERCRRTSSMLSGSMKLYDGTDWVDGRPRDFLYVPPAASAASAPRPTSLPPS